MDQYENFLTGQSFNLNGPMSILLILGTLIWGVFFVEEIFVAYKSYQTKNWKSCAGELIKWDIEGIVIFGSCFKDFRYKYIVSGKEYESNKVGLGFPPTAIGIPSTLFHNGPEIFEKVLINAPKVSVYYSPDNPQDSVLCTGIQDYHIVRIVGMGSVLCIFILAIFLM